MSSERTPTEPSLAARAKADEIVADFWGYKITQIRIRDRIVRALDEATARKRERCAPWKATHVHRKTGGHYREITRGRLEWDLREAVVYDNEGGHVWIRPANEFDDGRFAVIRTHTGEPINEQ